jgi:hypothetical protein
VHLRSTRVATPPLRHLFSQPLRMDSIPILWFIVSQSHQSRTCSHKSPVNMLGRKFYLPCTLQSRLSCSTQEEPTSIVFYWPMELIFTKRTMGHSLHSNFSALSSTWITGMLVPMPNQSLHSKQDLFRCFTSLTFSEPLHPSPLDLVSYRPRVSLIFNFGTWTL